MNPKITIIIPVYNAGKYLAPALESVMAQTFPDWECICVNDASTDDSVKIIKSFQEKDKRFVFIDRPQNGGTSAARNAALDAAKGEYITFLDQDDLLVPDAFETYMHLAEKYNADMVRTGYDRIGEDFMLPYTKKQKHREKFYPDVGDGLQKVLGNGKIRKIFYIWCCCIKRKIMGDLRFRVHGTLGEDLIFMADVYNKIGNFVQTDFISSLHRRSGTSQTLNGFKPVMLTRFLTTLPIIAGNYKDNNNNRCEQLYRWNIYCGWNSYIE